MKRWRRRVRSPGLLRQTVGPASLTLSALLAALPLPAAAQFNMVPPPQCPPAAQAASATEADYRVEVSRHLYECFPGRVYLGALPPLVYGVITVEAQIDATGRIATLDVVRKPAAEEVEPWVVALLRRAMPFPAPVNLPGGVARVVETFFVDRSGLFQVHSLTEGQQGTSPAEVATPLSRSP